MGNANKAILIDRNRKAADGVKKHLKGSILLAGGSYKPPEILTILGEPTTAADATDKAKAAYRAAVAAERTAKAAAKGMRGSLQSYLVGIHGAKNEILADFGFTITEPTPKTVETKNEAVVKMRATRKARGTMGPKQKSKIKGTVEIDATELAALQNAAAATTSAATSTATQAAQATTGTAKTGNGGT